LPSPAGPTGAEANPLWVNRRTNVLSAIYGIGTNACGNQDRCEDSVEGPGWGDPFRWLVGDGRDAVVVGVVVKYREPGGFSCGGDD
jgi:hypothetical protein